MLKIIKAQLKGAKGIWPNELPSVLWAYRTTTRTPTRETPFQLAYRSEAIIPAEVGLTSYRVDNHDEDKNDKVIRLQIDLVDEVKAIAEQRLARYQNLMAKHYNSKLDTGLPGRRSCIKEGDGFYKRHLPRKART